jgi:hypothetical protein
MKIVSRLALLGALLSAVQACATPVELKGCPAALPAADCDVLLASSGDFADAGLGGAAGNGAGGGSPGPSGGGAGGGSPVVGQGGTSNLGGGGTSSGLGGASQGGSSGLGGAGLGGAAGGGLGGAGGGAGTGAGGTGGASSAGPFNPNACDFDDPVGCEDVTCAALCPTNDGNSCLNRCLGVIECVSADECVRTEADPLCAVRPQGGGLNTCTELVEQAGGANPPTPNPGQPPQPSFVAREFVRCICSDPRL